jgi:hypothetical protein
MQKAPFAKESGLTRARTLRDLPWVLPILQAYHSTRRVGEHYLFGLSEDPAVAPFHSLCVFCGLLALDSPLGTAIDLTVRMAEGDCVHSFPRISEEAAEARPPGSNDNPMTNYKVPDAGE